MLSELKLQPQRTKPQESAAFSNALQSGWGAYSGERTNWLPYTKQ
jgi:hypothetical protein